MKMLCSIHAIAEMVGGERAIRPSDIQFVRRAEEFRRPRPTLIDLEIWYIVSQQPGSLLVESLYNKRPTQQPSITRAHVVRALHKMADVGLVKLVFEDSMIVSIQRLTD